MTKVGKVLYNITLNGGQFLDRHKILFFFLLLTWGSITTLLGLIVSLVMLICFRKPHRYHWSWYFELGKYWGGADFGCMFIRDKESDISLNEHEFGHSYQAAIFGPFVLVIAYIPSFIRYWWLTFSGKIDYVDYDGVWFEKSATDLGEILNRGK